MAEPFTLTLATAMLLRMATAAVRVVLKSSTAGVSAGVGIEADDSGLGQFVKAITDTVEGISSNAAHDCLKKVIAGAESVELDPKTRLPRNHDLQQASYDALRGAAQAFAWELAACVEQGKPWLPSLQDHLLKGKVRRLFADDAIAGEPKRAWVERLHALIGGPEFHQLHDSLKLSESEIRECVARPIEGLSQRFRIAFAQWTRAKLGSNGEPKEFDVLLNEGWRPQADSPALSLGLLYAHFFREYLKRRPEVFRIYMTDELAAVRGLVVDLPRAQEAAFAAFDDELTAQRGLLAALDDQMGRMLRQQAELGEQLGQVLAALVMLSTAHQRGNARAGDELRRLTGIEDKLDYLLGGIPLWRCPRPNAPTKDTELLMAQYRALPLTGRDEDLAALRSWLVSAPSISARLVIGKAGSGKTRLALELLREIENLWPHWQGGVLGQAELRRLVETKDLTQLDWKRPTLLLVDYAQALAAPLTTLLEALNNRVDDNGRPVLRVLLLERVAGGWFEQLLATGTASSYSAGPVSRLFHPPEAVLVTPLPDGEQRRTLLALALATVARLHGVRALAVPSIGSDPVVDEALAKERFGEPLQIAMAAIVAYDRGLRIALTSSRIDLARHVAKRERERIARFVMSDNPRLGREQIDMVAHLAACATLEQGFAEQELKRAVAEETLARGCEWPGGPGALERVLREALPSSWLAVGAIEPDFVGEAFVLTELARSESELPAEQWREWSGVIERCAQRDPRATPATLVHAWQNFGTATNFGAPLLAATDALIARAETTGGTSLLEGLMEAMPQTTVEFRERAARLAQRIYLAAKAAMPPGLTPGDNERANVARHANNLARRLSELGQTEAALTTAQEAVELYRELAKRQPDTFRPNLATSLSNVANHLSVVGRREAALTAAQEAVELGRELARKQPDAFRPHLAMALNTAAICLSELGQQKAALTAGQEAVELYRELAKKQSDVVRRYLAAALNNVASFLGALGQGEAALTAAQEVVELFRELAKKQPDAFRPDMAKALNNVAGFLSELGQWEPALTMAQEAVALHRELAKKQSDAFRPNLAMALNNVANCLSELGQKEAALTAAQEAVEIRRELAKKQPDAFRPRLANSLTVLGDCFSELERKTEAVAAHLEAALALLPYFLQLPQAHGGLFGAILRDYLAACERAETEPDATLVANLRKHGLISNGEEESP